MAPLATPTTPGSPPDAPDLVLCAHGTTDPIGRGTVESIARRLQARRPDVRVEVGYVDVQEPRVDEVVRDLTSRQRPVVVVPLLLASGYHVDIDVAEAVADNPYAVACGPLGPDPVLSCILVDRLIAAGAHQGDAVVIASAGSSSVRAIADLETVADMMRPLWAGPVTVGYGRAAQPSVADAVMAARLSGAARVAVAPYLLGRGHFFAHLSGCGADVVAQPLGADYKLISLVEARYDVGVGRLRRLQSGSRPITSVPRAS